MFDFAGFEFVASVAAALAAAAPVARNLGEIALGGRRLWEFGDKVFGWLGKRVPPAKVSAVLRQELPAYAKMPQLEFEKKVEQIIEVVMPEQTPENRRAASEYIKLIPDRVRTSFARREDPTGTTVPMTWAARSGEDLVPILPPRPSVFKAGDVPPQAPNWILTKRLGIGGFGEDWQARGIEMEDSFRAFKFCLDPESKKVLVNELKNIQLVQNKLVNQPNIVRLVETHLRGDTPWLCYECVDGGDLGHLMATWADDVAVRAAMAVEKIGILAATLSHCHQGFTVGGERKLVIHRDMKPANVLVDETGTLKITDFGIGNIQARQALDEARVATAFGMTGSTPTGILLANTPIYASPQQKDGMDPHPADDVHALGVMTYQMIVGDVHRALDNDYIGVLEEKHVCRPLIDLITRSIASDRKRRFQHAGELAEALRALPKKLVAPPVKIAPADQKAHFIKNLDTWYADADKKNAAAAGHIERREWAAAVKVLESKPHPRMREPDLWTRAIAHRDGKRFVNSLGIEFAIVPAGTYWMGGGEGKCGDKQVTIDCDFYLGVYPVTQEEWHKVMGSTPSYFRKGGAGHDVLTGVPDADLKRFPVENVSFNDCQEFLQKLNEKAKEQGWLYRLPREAEWEYACRGAATSQADCGCSYYLKSQTNMLSPRSANYSEAGLGRTSRVGLYQPNSLGLYDMHGNVWEWCEDDYNQRTDETITDLIPSSSPFEGIILEPLPISTEPAPDEKRVIRGGSWSSSGENCRTAYRSAYDIPTSASHRLGFRLARVVVR